ncbi:protein PF3D7_1417600 [Condylostylus longicornis]|uniref:protein PF3D7_1417600 n=1 Tax=Condylostylus longicornis TaxID=2530218 RepID=UPI00244DACF5|nr:protein PF3D7_1417600 [Condylostylus longicornis]
MFTCIATLWDWLDSPPLFTTTMESKKLQQLQQANSHLAPHQKKIPLTGGYQSIYQTNTMGDYHHSSQSPVFQQYQTMSSNFAQMNLSGGSSSSGQLIPTHHHHQQQSQYSTNQSTPSSGSQLTPIDTPPQPVGHHNTLAKSSGYIQQNHQNPYGEQLYQSSREARAYQINASGRTIDPITGGVISAQNVNNTVGGNPVTALQQSYQQLQQAKLQAQIQTQNEALMIQQRTFAMRQALNPPIPHLHLQSQQNIAGMVASASMQSQQIQQQSQQAAPHRNAPPSTLNLSSQFQPAQGPVKINTLEQQHRHQQQLDAQNNQTLLQQQNAMLQKHYNHIVATQEKINEANQNYQQNMQSATDPSPVYIQQNHPGHVVNQACQTQISGAIGGTKILPQSQLNNFQSPQTPSATGTASTATTSKLNQQKTPQSSTEESSNSPASTKSPTHPGLDRKKSSGASQAIKSPITKRPASSPVTLSGWLYKQGSDGLKVWRKRWFVLAEYCLYYYKGPEEEKLLGSILLPSYKVSACLPEDKIYRKYAFKCEHTNMRTYWLAAENSEQMYQWVRALMAATLMQGSGESSDQNSQPSNSSLNNHSGENSDSGIHTFQSSQQSKLSMQHGPITPASDNGGGIQPLYANAPPKPRRINDGGYSSPSPENSIDRNESNPSQMRRKSAGMMSPSIKQMQQKSQHHAIYDTRTGNVKSALGIPNSTEGNSQSANHYVSQQQRPEKRNTKHYEESRSVASTKMSSNNNMQQQKHQQQQPVPGIYNLGSMEVGNEQMRRSHSQRPSGDEIYGTGSEHNIYMQRVLQQRLQGQINSIPYPNVERRTPDAYGRSKSAGRFFSDYEDIYNLMQQDKHLATQQLNQGDLGQYRRPLSPPSYNSQKHIPSMPSRYTPNHLDPHSHVNLRSRSTTGLNRPHSADFLEYEARVEAAASAVRPDAIRAQRPKSSLDINRTPDSYYYSEESYAEKMRQSALYLQKSPSHNSSSIGSGNVGYNNNRALAADLSPYATGMNTIGYENPYERTVKRNELLNEAFLNHGALSVPRANHRSHGGAATPTSMLAKEYQLRQMQQNEQFLRSASARLPKKTEDPEVLNAQHKDGERKREESMKRLLEWKQRMLQSPLTRKGVQQSGSPSILKLGSNPNILAPHSSSGIQRSRSETHANAGYNSYSSDDEDVPEYTPAGRSTNLSTTTTTVNTTTTTTVTTSTTFTTTPPPHKTITTATLMSSLNQKSPSMSEIDTCTKNTRLKAINVKNVNLANPKIGIKISDKYNRNNSISSPDSIIKPHVETSIKKYNENFNVTKKLSEYPNLNSSVLENVNYIPVYKAKTALNNNPKKEGKTYDDIKIVYRKNKETQNLDCRPPIQGRQSRRVSSMKKNRLKSKTSEIILSNLDNNQTSLTNETKIHEIKMYDSQQISKSSLETNVVADNYEDIEKIYETQVSLKKENLQNHTEDIDESSKLFESQISEFGGEEDPDDLVDIDNNEEENEDELQNTFEFTDDDLNEALAAESDELQVNVTHPEGDENMISKTDEKQNNHYNDITNKSLSTSNETVKNDKIEMSDKPEDAEMLYENGPKTPTQPQSNEDHYLPMTPKKAILSPTNSLPLLHNINSDLEENPYVEMTKGEKDNQSKSNYETVCISSTMQHQGKIFLHQHHHSEPVYMELAQSKHSKSESYDGSSKLKESKPLEDALQNGKSTIKKSTLKKIDIKKKNKKFSGSSSLTASTLKRKDLPDILKPSQNTAIASDSSDADDESTSKEQSDGSNKMRSRSRFSLSDTFRPASYYLSANTPLADCAESSDSEIISPPPIPSTTPPMDADMNTEEIFSSENYDTVKRKDKLNLSLDQIQKIHSSNSSLNLTKNEVLKSSRLSLPDQFSKLRHLKTNISKNRERNLSDSNYSFHTDNSSNTSSDFELFNKLKNNSPSFIPGKPQYPTGNVNILNRRFTHKTSLSVGGGDSSETDSVELRQRLGSDSELERQRSRRPLSEDSISEIESAMSEQFEYDSLAASADLDTYLSRLQTSDLYLYQNTSNDPLLTNALIKPPEIFRNKGDEHFYGNIKFISSTDSLQKIGNDDDRIDLNKNESGTLKAKNRNTTTPSLLKEKNLSLHNAQLDNEDLSKFDGSYNIEIAKSTTVSSVDMDQTSFCTAFDLTQNTPLHSRNNSNISDQSNQIPYYYSDLSPDVSINKTDCSSTPNTKQFSTRDISNQYQLNNQRDINPNRGGVIGISHIHNPIRLASRNSLTNLNQSGKTTNPEQANVCDIAEHATNLLNQNEDFIYNMPKPSLDKNIIKELCNKNLKSPLIGSIVGGLDNNNCNYNYNNNNVNISNNLQQNCNYNNNIDNLNSNNGSSNNNTLLSHYNNKSIEIQNVVAAKQSKSSSNNSNNSNYNEKNNNSNNNSFDDSLTTSSLCKTSLSSSSSATQSNLHHPKLHYHCLHRDISQNSILMLSQSNTSNSSTNSLASPTVLSTTSTTPIPMSQQLLQHQQQHLKYQHYHHNINTNSNNNNINNKFNEHDISNTDTVIAIESNLQKQHQPKFQAQSSSNQSVFPIVKLNKNNQILLNHSNLNLSSSSLKNQDCSPKTKEFLVMSPLTNNNNNNDTNNSNNDNNNDATLNIITTLPNQEQIGEEMWEEDTLWRESLRRVSQRHARSLDDLDRISGNSGTNLNKIPVQYQQNTSTTKQKGNATKQSDQGDANFSKVYPKVQIKPKISRDVTYVNDNVSQQLLRTKNFRSRLNEFVPTTSAGSSTPHGSLISQRDNVFVNSIYDDNNENDVYVQLANQTLLARHHHRHQNNENMINDIIDNDDDDDIDTGDVYEILREDTSSNYSRKSIEIDRETIRQWDSMSSGLMKNSSSASSKSGSGGGGSGIGTGILNTNLIQLNKNKVINRNYEVIDGNEAILNNNNNYPSINVVKTSNNRNNNNNCNTNKEHNNIIVYGKSTQQTSATSNSIRPYLSNLKISILTQKFRLLKSLQSKCFFNPSISIHNVRNIPRSNLHVKPDPSDPSYGYDPYYDPYATTPSEVRYYNERNNYYNQYEPNEYELQMQRDNYNNYPLRKTSSRAEIDILERETSSQIRNLDVSAGDLLSRSHEELVLLLIQLRRQSSQIARAIEQCCTDIHEAQNRILSAEGLTRAESIQRLDYLKQHLLDLEKQYEKSKPLVNLVDNMVKLGSLYRNNENSMSRNNLSQHQMSPSHHLSSSTSSIIDRTQQRRSESVQLDRLEFSNRLTDRRMLQEEQRFWDGLTPNQSELQSKVRQLYQLDQLLQEESGTLQSLQRDKEDLERALGGLRARIQDSTGPPLLLEAAKKQQLILERELSRVHQLLAENSKKLEQTVASNARLEQELLILRQKLQASRESRGSQGNIKQASGIPSSESTQYVSSTTALLESELRRVQSLVVDMQRQRQDLSEAVRQLTENSNRLYKEIGEKASSITASLNQSQKGRRNTSCWTETDLDSMVSIDHTSNNSSSPSDNLTTPLYIDTSGNNSTQNHNNDNDIYSLDNRHRTEADDYTENTQFTNLTNQEKQEIKTVRIVKRESERRHRERGSTAVTMSNQNLDQVMEEDPQIIQNHTEESHGRSKSLPRSYNDHYEHYKQNSYSNGQHQQQNHHYSKRKEMQHRLMTNKQTTPGGPVRYSDYYAQNKNEHNTSSNTNPYPISTSDRNHNYTVSTATSTNYQNKSNNYKDRLLTQTNSNRYNMNQHRNSNNINTDGNVSNHKEEYRSLQNQCKTESMQSLNKSITDINQVFQSEAARQIISEMSAGSASEDNGVSDKRSSSSTPLSTTQQHKHRRAIPREKRRHNTAPNNVNLKAMQKVQAENDMNRNNTNWRARDDLDMEVALRPRNNAPDVVRSALGQGEKISENTIDRLFGAPNKILIPERYIPEKAPELSPEEKKRRQEKVEAIKKMLSEAPINSSNDTVPQPPSKINEEKKQREHLLQLNQILAQQVMQMSKIVAEKAMANLPSKVPGYNNYISTMSEEDQIISPTDSLPIYQQRDNFFT